VAGVEQLRRREGVNLVQLEADIASIRSGSSIASIALPDYVEHTEGVTRVGALSAEAVIRDYESAAKEIEAMGTELIDAAQKCEALTAQVHDAIAFMRETAAGYREEGRKIFKRIEECALFTEDVRKTCEQVKRRMKDGSIGVSSDEESAPQERELTGLAAKVSVHEVS
jgi:chromosome segregation ATPase